MKIVRTPHSRYTPKTLFDGPLNDGLSATRDDGQSVRFKVAWSDDSHRTTIALDPDEMRRVISFWFRILFVDFGAGDQLTPLPFYLSKNGSAVFKRPHQGQMGFKVCEIWPGVDPVEVVEYLNKAEALRQAELIAGKIGEPAGEAG